MKVQFISRTMRPRRYSENLKWVTNQMRSHNRDLEERIPPMEGTINQPFYATRRAMNSYNKLLYKTTTLWSLRIPQNHTKFSTSRNAATNFLTSKSSSRTLSCKNHPKRNMTSSRRAKVREVLQELLMTLENLLWKSNTKRRAKSNNRPSLHLKTRITNHWPESIPNPNKNPSSRKNHQNDMSDNSTKFWRNRAISRYPIRKMTTKSAAQASCQRSQD